MIRTLRIGLVACGMIALAPVAASRHQVLAQETPSRDLTIEVQNQNFNDATVYAVRPGLRQRIGFVVGLRDGKFTFRWPDGDLRMEIALLAGGHYYTQLMDVQAGDELKLTILPYLHTLPSGSVF